MPVADLQERSKVVGPGKRGSNLSSLGISSAGLIFRIAAL